MARYAVRSCAFPGDSDPDTERQQARALLSRGFVQTVRATAADNAFFVEVIAAQTLRAWEKDELVARRPEIDFILRMAGTSQISKALGEVGSRKGASFVLVVASPGRVPMGNALRGRALARRDLSLDERDRVERAALLGALRG